VIRLRVTGGIAEVQLALFRLRGAFSAVSASGPQPCPTEPGLVVVDVEVAL